jgi:hypothetical protein
MRGDHTHIAHRILNDQGPPPRAQGPQSNGEQQPTPLTEASVQQTLGEVVGEAGALEGAELYLKVGRKVARIDV